MEQSLTVGLTPQIVIESVAGDLTVTGGEGGELRAVSDDDSLQLEQNGDRVTVVSFGDLSLSLPRGATLTLEQVSGDASLRDLSGPVKAEAVAGELTLENIAKAVVEPVSPGHFAASQAQRITREVNSKVQSALHDAERKARKAERKAHKWNVNWTAAPGPKSEPVSDEERMTILRMLQEKKITAEEAEKLLSALE